MQTHVDYLSISLLDSVGGVPVGDTQEFHDALYRVAGGSWLWDMLVENKAREGGGRKPFSKSLSGGGVTYWWHPKMQNSLLEFSGRGCNYLREVGLLENVVRQYVKRITRIDIASDIDTKMTPAEFLPDADIPKRIISRDSIVSKTGLTLYVGSFKGSEFTRIYRYFKPHPRADLLRVETVFRHENAKDAAGVWLANGVAPLLERTRQRIGITNPLYDVEKGSSRATFYRSNNGNPSTLNWMCGTVAKSFKRLVHEGAIEDPLDFLNRYFLS